MDYAFVARYEWRAVQPLWKYPLPHPVSNVFVELSKKTTCHSFEQCVVEVQFLQRYNMKLPKNPDVRYNFMIGGDGAVYEGRGWDTVARLPVKYQDVRRNGIFIALLGKPGDVPPDSGMYDTLYKLIRYGISQNYITKKFLEYTLH